MDRDEFMELVYETFADEPDNVLANGIIEAADAYAEHEKAQLSQEGTTSDLISRQAAIDGKIVIQRTNGVEIYSDEAVPVEYLKNLPSRQPEPSTNCSEIPNSSDTISRQAVIDALHTWFRDGFDEDKWWNSTHVLAAIEGLHPVQQEHKWETCFECPLSHGCPKIKGCTNEQAIEYASQIPNDCPLSAQPERKRGEWVYNSPVTMKCNRCGLVIKDWDWHRFKICPNCGADMRGKNDG